MAFDLRVAGRFVSRLAVGERGRRPAAVLLALGSIAIVAGAAILLVSLAPYFANPASAAALSPRLPAEAGPIAAGRTALAPTTLAALPAPTSADANASAAQPVDGVWFEIRIPILGYGAVVRQGVDTSVLDRGPGHYPTTPWPGQRGNVAVAGHNTFWLSFSHLKPGDRVEIQTANGLYVYEITGSKIVSPTDRTVLVATADDRLTLTTCYPLWAGAFATQRLIFTAREIGGVA